MRGPGCGCWPARSPARSSARSRARRVGQPGPVLRAGDPLQRVQRAKRPGGVVPPGPRSAGRCRTHPAPTGRCRPVPAPPHLVRVERTPTPPASVPPGPRPDPLGIGRCGVHRSPSRASGRRGCEPGRPAGGGACPACQVPGRARPAPLAPPAAIPYGEAPVRGGAPGSIGRRLAPWRTVVHGRGDDPGGAPIGGTAVVVARLGAARLDAADRVPDVRRPDGECARLWPGARRSS